jgi:hypothetical protein
MKKILPDTIFVKWEGMGRGEEPYLATTENVADLSEEVGTTVPYGIYKLTHRKKLKTIINSNA